MKGCFFTGILFFIISLAIGKGLRMIRNYFSSFSINTKKPLTHPEIGLNKWFLTIISLQPKYSGVVTGTSSPTLNICCFL